MYVDPTVKTDQKGAHIGLRTVDDDYVRMRRLAETSLDARWRLRFASGRVVPWPAVGWVVILGAALIVTAASDSAISTGAFAHISIWPFSLSIAAAALAPFLGLVSVRHQSFMTIAAACGFAVVVLPPGQAALAALVAGIVDWIWRRTRSSEDHGYATPLTRCVNAWSYIWPTLAAAYVIHYVHAEMPALRPFGALAAAATFALIESVIIATYLALGRLHHLGEALMDMLFIEFAVASIGVAAGALWLSDWSLSFLVLAPLILARRGQRVPLLEEKARLLELEQVARERLEELDRMKDEFVALVAHELRTPIVSITGFAELLDEQSADWPANQRQYLDTILRNATRLDRIVEDLSTLREVERQMEVQLLDVGLSAIVEQAVAGAETRATNKQVKLESTVVPEIEVSGDATRLAQVADNLIGNAIKYTPEGGHVTITVERDVDRAVLEVADNGPGLSQADQARLFERFFRTAEARASRTPGTGLGLAIVKLIVEKHGGEVSVSSTLGVGTCFRVELPLLEKPARSAVSPASAPSRLVAATR
jgi:signal transduction histidine kinase